MKRSFIFRKEYIVAKKNSFTDFGWLVDESHPVTPKMSKQGWFDIAVGLGITVIGIAYTAITSFYHGAHGLQDDEFRILMETNKIDFGDKENSKE